MLCVPFLGIPLIPQLAAMGAQAVPEFAFLLTHRGERLAGIDRQCSECIPRPAFGKVTGLHHGGFERLAQIRREDRHE
jgi:hypothetical protein